MLLPKILCNFSKSVINNNLRRNFSIAKPQMANLKEIVESLDKFAPLQNAESWDNVGLLIAPSTEKAIKTIFLTNDLTEPVMAEALENNADLIISYHPPIFSSLKRITQDNWKERIVCKCIENRIALYSPHTSWDFCNDGVTDFLAASLSDSESNITPIKTNDADAGGIGRLARLGGDTTLKKAIENVKHKLGLKGVQLALGNGRSLQDCNLIAAVCAGSGSSVLKGVKADIYLTGEMSHHDLLDATHNGTSVILCNHSNSERAYLNYFAKRFQEFVPFSGYQIIVSKTDVDPLVFA